MRINVRINSSHLINEKRDYIFFRFIIKHISYICILHFTNFSKLIRVNYLMHDQTNQFCK